MIVTTNMPQQQACNIHLVMAVFILFLTVYPYLLNSNNVRWSVAAYSALDINLKHYEIEKFDIIEKSDIVWSRSISTRDTSLDKQLLHNSGANEIDAILGPTYDNNNHNSYYKEPEESVRKVQFTSLGKRFNLVLTKAKHLVTQDFNVIAVDSDGKETIVPYNRDEIQVLDGFLDGEEQSRAMASFNQERLMIAQIKTGQDTIIVEPTYLHAKNLFNQTQDTSEGISDTIVPDIYADTMIVYNLRDHKQFNYELNDSNHLFNPVTLCSGVDLPENTKTNTSNFEDIFRTSKRIHKRKFQFRRGLEHLTDQANDKTRCTLHLVADYLFYNNVGKGDLQTTINYLLALVNRVNQIYLPTVWETGEEDSKPFSNIGFTVQNITIHQEYTRISTGDLHYNMESRRVWGAREFLDNFSKYSPPRHYCLAHLLTYRQFDSPVLGLAYVASTRYGTIGGICSPTQQKGDIFYKHNTGISTSKGISGETLITRQADLVVAHELGHNFGAEHDSNECRPSPSKGGAYLMHPYAVMGFEKNNRFLSNCSRLSIGRVIRKKATSCFVGVIDHICGNGIVEDNEECDGGDVGFGHNDPCCDSFCRFTPGSQCSDRHSRCCSKCRISPAGIACRPAEEYICKQASYCDGQGSECPPSPPVGDNESCVGRGLCRSGDCIPFCEARDLISCLCNAPHNACKLCCKSSPNGTCVPYDNKAPHLPDGVLCYRGVCEKGRCEQPIQDVVERLWDVIEDINFTTFVKFLRDNIIFVVLVASIPIWWAISHYINEFDKRIKQDVINAIMKSSGRRRQALPIQSPFLPRLFVGDEISSSNSADDINNLKSNQLPLRPIGFNY